MITRKYPRKDRAPLRLAFWLIGFALFQSACSLELIGSTTEDVGGGAGGGGGGGGGSTPPSTATATLIFPDHLSDRLGYLKLFHGTCSNDGNQVRVLSGATVLATGTCSSGTYDLYADTSGLGVGDHVLTVAHADDDGIEFEVESGTLNKFSTNCDSLANRQNNLAASLAGGSGSLGDPYVVCTADQAQEMADQANTYFAMGNDIYFSHGDTNGDLVVDGSDTDYVSGSGWTPINTVFCCGMTSGFSGNRFAIEGMQISRPATNEIGFFGAAGNMFFKNLRFYDSQVVGQDTTGTLVGLSGGLGSIYDVHVLNLRSGSSVSGNQYVGGIAGNMDASMVAQVSVDADIVGTSSHVGGISGRLYSNALHWAKTSGTVTGTANVGGILGMANTNVNLTHAYSSSHVTGTTGVGGIVGTSYTVIFIENAYATGDIIGTGENVGGLAGELQSGAILNSFFAGRVSGTSAADNIGYIVGMNDMVGIILTLTNAYYGPVTCSDSNAGGGVCNTDGTLGVIADFQDPDSLAMSGWDFEGRSTDGTSDVWHMNASPSYPQIYYQKDQSTYTPHLAGSGTAADPYLIATGVDFAEISSNPRYAQSHLRLTANIDLSLIPGFQPLYRSGIFTGTLDGDNFTISNFVHTEVNRSGTGLIHHITNATITDFNLHVSGSVTTAGGYNYRGRVGALASSVLGDTQISRLRIYGPGSVDTPANGDASGGICALGVLAVNQSSVELDINGVGAHHGGLIGEAAATRIFDSYHQGTISGRERLGGIVGFISWSSVVHRSYHFGDITAIAGEVGGLLGWVADTNIQDSYSSGAVEGSSVSSNIGLLIGHNQGMVTSSGNHYWSAQICSNGGGGGCYAHGTGDAAEINFQTDGSSPVVNWDFTTIWMDNSGTLQYPTLR